MTGSPEQAKSMSALDRCWKTVAERRRSHPPGRLLVAGICGAQGSGKSTLAEGLRDRLENDGWRVALLSLDDLYLSHEARRQLAVDIHPLLATRGVPGTHDVDLAQQVIAGLDAGKPTALPRFDKASDTRLPMTRWPVAAGEVDILLFEGWCVGAAPQPEASLAVPVNDLEREYDADGRWRTFVNETLARAYAPLFARIDLLVLLSAPGFDIVAAWRGQQERELRDRLIAQGTGLDRTMNEAELHRFISHYQRLTQHILAEMPSRADLVIRLDRHRHVIPGAVSKRR